MKIAYYTSNRLVFPPPADQNGASLSITALIVDQLKNRHEITVYAAKGSKLDGVTIKDLGISASNLDSSVMNTDWSTKVVLGYKQIHLGQIIADADQYDIIHLQTEPIYLGMPFVALTKTPILFTPHHPYYEIDRPIYEFYDKKVFISALSDYHATSFPLSTKPSVVHNGLDLSLFEPSMQNNGYFLFLGRLTADKGTSEFLELSKLLPNETFYIAGSGPLEQEVRKAESEQNNLNYFGKVAKNSREWQDLFSKAKALIFPVTGEESFGLTTIEAMAFGTPVIAYKRCAMPEIIKDGTNGFLVDVGVDNLVDSIQKTQKLSGDQYLDMRKNARSTVENKFSATIMAEKYEDLYKQIIASSRKK